MTLVSVANSGLDREESSNNASSSMLVPSPSSGVTVPDGNSALKFATNAPQLVVYLVDSGSSGSEVDCEESSGGATEEEDDEDGYYEEHDLSDDNKVDEAYVVSAVNDRWKYYRNSMSGSMLKTISEEEIKNPRANIFNGKKADNEQKSDVRRVKFEEVKEADKKEVDVAVEEEEEEAEVVLIGAGEGEGRWPGCAITRSRGSSSSGSDGGIGVGGGGTGGGTLLGYSNTNNGYQDIYIVPPAHTRDNNCRQSTRKDDDDDRKASSDLRCPGDKSDDECDPNPVYDREKCAPPTVMQPHRGYNSSVNSNSSSDIYSDNNSSVEDYKQKVVVAKMASTQHQQQQHRLLRSALKRQGQRSRGHRVTFNESRNQFRDPDYVILFQGDSEPQLVSIRSLELGLPPPPAPPVLDGLTLSPPDGYKDCFNRALRDIVPRDPGQYPNKLLSTRN